MATLQSKDSITEILHGVHLSDIHGATNAPSRASHSITAVLSLLSGPASSYVELEKALSVTPVPQSHLHIDIDDSPDASLLSMLQSALRFAVQECDPPRKNVLIHCFAGQSRSVAVVLALVLAKFSFSTVEAALDFIRASYPRANPSVNFRRQLTSFAVGLRDTCKSRTYSGSLGYFQLALQFTFPNISRSWPPHFSRGRSLLLQEALHLLATKRDLLLRFRTRQPKEFSVWTHPQPSHGSDDASTDQLEARCRSCRHAVIATSAHVISGNVFRDSTVQVFIPRNMFEKLLSADPFLEQKRGRLRCCRCDSKVGSYEWSPHGLADDEFDTRFLPSKLPRFSLVKSTVDWLPKK